MYVAPCVVPIAYGEFGSLADAFSSRETLEMQLLRVPVRRYSPVDNAVAIYAFFLPHRRKGPFRYMSTHHGPVIQTKSVGRLVICYCGHAERKAAMAKGRYVIEEDMYSVRVWYF